MKKPIRILNLDTDEEYKSLQDAGRKLGYLTPLKVPDWAMDSDEEFVRRGHRLKVLSME